ncbi:histidine decarboxylase [Stylonychia lemnae]|uniref:Histidine decarboxylase n=1 Tax=Stylonychia lemnae TaxID=5949 RepID=A0A078A2B5_STYLE|nr:histidine decarboxylase [Stylonychia lemnae]|eukprot:CDW75653.1 histidine decarboxylase [Stylonychia lemnae]
MNITQRARQYFSKLIRFPTAISNHEMIDSLAPEFNSAQTSGTRQLKSHKELIQEKEQIRADMESFNQTNKTAQQEYQMNKESTIQKLDSVPSLRFHNHERANLQSFHQNLQKKFDDHTTRQLSFPIRHHNFEHMGPYLRHYLNNHGDSFQKYKDYNSLRTRQFEKEVVHWFSELYRSPNPERVWGYMPSGSTESNLQAVYLAREYFKDHQDVAVFFSQQAHSSLNKSIYYLRMNSFSQLAKTKGYTLPMELQERGMIEWPERVPTLENGEIDTEVLQYLLRSFADQRIPIVLSLTVGTTSGSAFDNVQKVIEALNSYEFYKDNRNHWIHIDGAWCGPYARLLDIASQNKMNNLPIEEIKNAQFDFSLEQVKSITTSIHKWIPSPFPSSILLIRDKELMPSDNLKEIYIRGQDYTLTTSRSGHAPLFTWDYLMTKNLKDHVDEALFSLDLAIYMHKQMEKIEKTLGINLKICRGKLGLNIRFKKPSDEICYKYGLLVLGNEAVVFIMPDKSKELCDNFIEDLQNDLIFQEEQ